MSKILPIFLTVFLVSLFLPKNLNAQVPISGVALTVPIADQNAKNGDIICSNKNGYVPCSNSYDSGMYGVINDNPIGSVELIDGGRLVNTTGTVKVNVTTNNGKI